MSQQHSGILLEDVNNVVVSGNYNHQSFINNYKTTNRIASEFTRDLQFMSPINDTANDTANDTVNDTTNDTVNDTVKLSESEKNVFKEIIKNNSITRKRLSEKLGKSESSISRCINELKKEGFIKAKSNDKNGKWIINNIINF